MENIFDGLDLQPYCAGFTASLLAGIDYVDSHSNEIDVVNLSLECYCHSDNIEQALKKLIADGVIVVVAAGNANEDTSSFTPTDISGEVVVSNIVDTDGKCGGVGPTSDDGNDDTLASDSNFGSTISLAAPGVDIKSTWNNGSYNILTGTSMSAPLVTGALALYKVIHPGLSSQQIIEKLVNDSIVVGTLCDGKNKGYFSGDRDNFHEPLLFINNTQ